MTAERRHILKTVDLVGKDQEDVPCAGVIDCTADHRFQVAFDNIQHFNVMMQMRLSAERGASFRIKGVAFIFVKNHGKPSRKQQNLSTERIVAQFFGKYNQKTKKALGYKQFSNYSLFIRLLLVCLYVWFVDKEWAS